MRALGRPKLGMLNLQSDIRPGLAGRAGDLGERVPGADFDGITPQQRGSQRPDDHSVVIHVGRDDQLGDESGADRFQPNGLPNAARRGLPDTIGLSDLFPVRLGAGIGRVPD